MIIKANKSNWSKESGVFKVNKTEKSITFNDEKFFIRCVAKHCYEVHNTNYGKIAYVYADNDKSIYYSENVSQCISRSNKCMYTAIYQLLCNII